MTQEDKELLLKDLCTRVPYGVRYRHFAWDDERGEECIAAQIYSINLDGYVKNCYDDETDNIDNVRPYLFPLSSMTSEQLFEVQEIMGKNEIEIEDGFFNIIDSSRNTITYLEILAVLEWFYKNHFDINGLIEKGLAIDATGLNIY